MSPALLSCACAAIPWMILRLGRYLGFFCCFSAISAPRRSRMALAMLLPSSLVATMAAAVVANDLCCWSREGNRPVDSRDEGGEEDEEEK